MKKRALALLLSAVMLLPLTVPAGAVQPAAGEPEEDLVLLDTIQAAGAEAPHTFPETPSGPLPELPEEGFLHEWEEPLPTPDGQSFLAEIGQPEEGATVITTAEELKALASAKGGSYVLGNDIDLSGETDWTSISMTLTKSLTLDGQGHTIRGLTKGLMSVSAKTTRALTVRNLRLELADGFAGNAAMFTSCSSYITLTVDNCVVVGDITSTSAYTGGVAGYASGTVSDCRALLTEEGQIQQIGGISDYGTGGVAGYAGSVTNCYARGGSVTTTQRNAGGVVGKITGDCTACYAANITVQSKYYAGGVVGYTGETSFVADCTADAAVSGTYSAGGVVGYGGYVERCYATGTVTSATAGGVAGTAVLVTDSTADAVVSGSDYAGGILGNGEVRNGYVYQLEVISETGYAGGLVGRGTVRSGNAEQVHVSGEDYVGGIVGNGNALSCSVWDVTVESTENYAGGVVGWSGNSTSDCTAVRATVSGDYAGGIAGSGNASNSTATGCTVTGVSYAGGITGIGTTTDCAASNLTVTASNTSIAAGAGGISGGSGTQVGATATGCTISGYFAGGITGTGGRLQGCTAADCTVTAAKAAGGITGGADRNTTGGTVAVYISGCTATDCTVTGELYAGGILGCIDTGVYYYSGEIGLTACQVEGGTVDAAVPYDETTHKVLTYVGGLVGYCDAYGEIRFSDFGGALGGNGYYIGGLVGYLWAKTSKTSTTIDQCRVTEHLSLTSASKIGSVGGLVGRISYTAQTTSNVVDEETTPKVYISSCSTKGLTADLADVANLGGLIGFVSSQTRMWVEHCTVDGNLTMRSGSATYAGGLLGGAYGQFYLADCWIRGDVSFETTWVDDVYRNGVQGSLAGFVIVQNKDCCYYYQCGIVREAGDDPEHSIWINGVRDEALAAGSFAEGRFTELSQYAYVTGGDAARTIAVTVYGGTLGQPGTVPLAGAKVTVGGQSAYTDGNGVAMLDCAAGLLGTSVALTVTRDGYPDSQFWSVFTTNHAYTSVTMWRLDPGKVYITDGNVQLTATRTRPAFNKNWVNFVQESDQSYDVNFSINWNGHTPQSVVLKGAKSGKTVALTPTAYGAYGSVCFAQTFAANETIVVEAVAAPEEAYGDIRGSAATCWRVQPLRVKIEIDDPEGDSMSGDTFFLDGLGVKLQLGDLVKCAGSVSYEKGVLTLGFDVKSSTKEQGSLFTTNDTSAKDSITVSGSVSIPIEKENESWRGKLKVGINNTLGLSTDGTEIKRNDAEEEATYNHTFNFVVMGVPCYVETSLGSSGTIAVELYGKEKDTDESEDQTGQTEWDLCTIGSLSVGVEGSAGGGVGGSAYLPTFNDKPNLELKIGVEGKLSADLKGTFDTGKLNVEGEKPFNLNPAFGGEINGKASVRVFFLDLSKKLTFGSFKWDPTNGLTWDSIFTGQGEATAQLMELSDEEAWQLLGRDYLAAGGGYVGDSLALLEESGEPVTVYANIAPAAELAQTVSSSGTMLYYTAERADVANQLNAMTLYCVVDGGDPVALDATETADYAPAASGSFVAWLDTKTAAALGETVSETDICQYLMGSEIAVSRYTGSDFAEKTILTDADETSYVFAPAVAASGQGSDAQAIVTWLRVPDALTKDTIFRPAATEIWYALYDGSTWGTAQKAANVTGTVSTLTADYDGTGFRLDYQLDDQVYTITVTPSADEETADTVSEPALSLEDARFYTRLNGTQAWMDNAGTLHVGTKTVSIPLPGAPSETPALAVYNNAAGQPCYQIYWAQGRRIYTSTRGTSGDWSAPVLLYTEEGAVRELTVRVSSNSATAQPTLAYLVDTADSGTQLRTLVPNAYMPVLESLTQYADTLVAVIRNDGYQTQSGYSGTAAPDQVCSWTLTDESGETVLSGSTEPILPGATATVVMDRTDLAVGTYTLSLANTTNNVTGESFTFAIETAPCATVAIEDAYWQDDSLRIQVRPGGVATGDLTLTLSDGEDTIVTETVTDYEKDLPYLVEIPVEDVPEGVFLLTAALNGASDSQWVGNLPDSQSGGRYLEVADWTAEDTASTVYLTGETDALAGAMIYAATYGTDGQMLRYLPGTLSADGAVAFSGRLEAGWALYILDGETGTPVCSKLLLS